MSRCFGVSLISAFIFCGLLTAGEWWEKTPYMQWSHAQVERILNDSPWVALSQAGRRRSEAINPRTNHKVRSGEWLPVYYRIELLTARPVREALLRRISLEPGAVIHVHELNKTDEEKEQLRLDDFLALNPDSILIKGDEEHIVLSLRLLVAQPATDETAWEQEIWEEEDYGAELSEADLKSLPGNTSLETNTRKRVENCDFSPPGPDKLGTKIYFKRLLPDGTPFISDGDRELRFETRLNKRKVSVKFNLKKTVYNGKLEI
jgi:hypothetical protein